MNSILETETQPEAISTIDNVYLSLTYTPDNADIVVYGVTQSTFNSLDPKNSNRNGTTTFYQEDSHIFIVK